MNIGLKALVPILGFLIAGVATSSLAKEADRRSLQIDDYFALKYVGSPVVTYSVQAQALRMQ